MRTSLLLSFALLSTCLSAHAAPLYYSYTGVETGGRTDTLTFTVPNPAAYLLDSASSFSVNTSSLLFDGTTLTSAAAFSDSSHTATDSGLQVNGGQFGLDFLGSLFTGAGTTIFNTNPTLMTGTFTLDPLTSALDFSGSTYRYSSGSLVVSASPIAPAAITPEPSSAVLLCTGVLGIAGGLRRRFAWIPGLR